MLLRSKTKDLFEHSNLNKFQRQNIKLNESEMLSGNTVLESYPRRLVFELTNACNLNCIMCGRNDSHFKPTIFDINWIEKFGSILNKVEEVTLMGWGEPTVHPNFIDFLRILNKYDVKKYFCTNGMKLDELKDEIFINKVDLMSVSLDGAIEKTNNEIRKGSDFNKIINSLSEITKQKKQMKLKYPYINFVFTAMKSNINELPKMIELANDIGIEEVKVVYLTVFDDRLLPESLYNHQTMVSEIFDQSINLANSLDINIKIPYIQGEDVGGQKFHKDCYVGWRDFFLGSDGYIRACMSSPVKLFSIDKYNTFENMWNSKEYIEFRELVNNHAKMYENCKSCYQSSHANWNNKDSFIQIGKNFAPEWS